jgi:O-antigen ligase
VILGVSFLLPNHYSPWTSFHQELGAAIAFAPLVIWTAASQPRLPAIALLALLFSLVPLVQFVFGKIYFAGDAWIAFLYIAGFGVAVAAGSRFATVPAQQETTWHQLIPFWMALTLSALVSVAIAVHQWLDLGLLGIFIVDMPPGGRPFANFAQPNQLATLLLLGIAGIAFLFELGRLRGWIGVVAIVVLLFGIVMTGSRSPVLALVWLYPAYFLLRRRCGLRTTPLAFTSLTLLFAAGLLSWASLNEAMLLGSSASSAVGRLSTPGVRVLYWQSMLDAISRAPWTGFGWGQLGLAQNLVALDHPATHEYFESAHNLILDLILANGVPIGLSISAALFAWFYSQVQRCRDPSTWATLLALGFLFNHAMLEYPLHYAFFLLPAGFLMGVLAQVQPTTWDLLASRIPRLPSTMVVNGFALSCLVGLGVVGFEYPGWENEWRKLQFEERKLNYPSNTERMTPLLLTQIDELIKLSRTDIVPGMPAAQLENMRKVSLRFSYPSSMYRYALALALNGDPTTATTVLERLCAMQAKKHCIDASSQWKKLADNQYPQLLMIPFPVTAGDTDNVVLDK